MAYSRSPYHYGRDPFQKPTTTPGPLGHNDAASPDTPAAFVGDTPGPLGINDHADPNVHERAKAKVKAASRTKWDPVAAAAFLKEPSNGWAGIRSKGRCARAVRQAINAGHLATLNNPVSAADYRYYLPTLGFMVLNIEGYTPKVGDIAVFPAVPEAGHVHGHIAMYTGDGWHSDYIQDRKSTDGKYGKGFFANAIWASKPFTIFRRRGDK